MEPAASLQFHLRSGLLAQAVRYPFGPFLAPEKRMREKACFVDLFLSSLLSCGVICTYVIRHFAHAIEVVCHRYSYYIGLISVWTPLVLYY